MRAMVVRQKLVLAAVATAGAALLGGLWPDRADRSGDRPDRHWARLGTAGPVGPKATYKAGALLVSNGTNTVMIGDAAVRFPTTVTDAAFSHDGSRIAFVDADGNIATAHPDGTGVVVVTKKAAGVTRSSPTWSGTEIIYTHRDKDGAAKLFQVVVQRGFAYDGARLQRLRDLTTTAGPRGQYRAERECGRRSRGRARLPAHRRQGRRGVGGGHQPARALRREDRRRRRPPRSRPMGRRWPSSRPTADLGYRRPQWRVPSPFRSPSARRRRRTSRGRRTAPGRLRDQLPGWSRSPPSRPAATANPATVHATKPGVPTFAPPARDSVGRLTGADRSRRPSRVAAALPEAGRSTARATAATRRFGAILTGTTGVGATVAAVSVLADRYAAPLLFTHGAGLDPRTKAELRRLARHGRRRTIGRWSPSLAAPPRCRPRRRTDVKALGYDTQRIAGERSVRPLACRTPARTPRRTSSSTSATRPAWPRWRPTPRSDRRCSSARAGSCRPGPRR